MASVTKAEVSGSQSLLPTLLLVLFVALKLTGVISWPWVWVLAPLWIPLALVALVLLVIGAVLLITSNKKKGVRK